MKKDKYCVTKNYIGNNAPIYHILEIERAEYLQHCCPFLIIKYGSYKSCKNYKEKMEKEWHNALCKIMGD